jgi:hypothetical protein
MLVSPFTADKMQKASNDKMAVDVQIGMHIKSPMVAVEYSAFPIGYKD